MSEYNLIWRKYGLKDNPYFNSPLTIEGGTIPLSSFVGREKERIELKRVIEMGSDIRFMITGMAGVGKTSLVNFVRNEASNNGFFTPIREVEINRIMTGNEIIILTLSVIYDEIKRLQLKLDEKLTQKLEALYELTTYGEISLEISNIATLNRQKLINLFRELINQIVNPRFKGIIIHYDNLDNIDDLEGFVDLMSDIRDFLLTRNVVFILVGANWMPAMIASKPRLSQIFLTPALEVPPLSHDNIKQILTERINQLRIEDNIPTISPHTEEALNTLFELHTGNLREILNSLTSCILSLPSSNTPIQITDDLLRDTLFQKVQERFLLKLTPIEKEILFKMLNKNSITPTELRELTGKTIQNISSKYLPKLMSIGAVRLKGAEGRYRFYEVTPEIRWWQLERTEKQKTDTKFKKEAKIKEVIDKSLKDFY